MFRNSEAEVAAETEKAFIGGFMSSFAGLMRVILIVGFLVVGAVVLIAANTSAMGIRERIPEIAILKSIGFRRRPILTALLAESTLQGLVGGLLGAGGRLRRARSASPGGQDRRQRHPRPARRLPHVARDRRRRARHRRGRSDSSPASCRPWNGARTNVIEALRRLF